MKIESGQWTTRARAAVGSVTLVAVGAMEVLTVIVLIPNPLAGLQLGVLLGHQVVLVIQDVHLFMLWVSNTIFGSVLNGA